MRIVIDMQGAQAVSRHRGIGRYSLAIVQAMVRNRGDHEIILALNGLIPDSIEAVRAAFDGLLPQKSIRVWEAVGSVAQIDSANDWRRQSAQLIREAFLASLRPDLVLLTSLFEGLHGNAATSIGHLPVNYVTAVIVYDFIPKNYPEYYLKNPKHKFWYCEKIEYLHKADLCLAISDWSRKDALRHLGFANEYCVNISSGVESHFSQVVLPVAQKQVLREKYSLQRPFIMYTGGIDFRKNIEGLIRAYAKLPQQLRATHQLAIVCSINSEDKSRLERLGKNQGLAADELILTGFVPDADLVALYKLCALFVFPSWSEGFGLPLLEAMGCGAPVIAANTTSLPEIVGLPEALFDPYCDEAIAQAMTRVLSDGKFRQRLIEHGRVQVTKFSWDETARRAIQAMERVFAERTEKRLAIAFAPSRPKLAYVSPLPPEHTGIADYSSEAIPVLAKYYEIEVIVAQDAVTDPWINSNCSIRTVEWFKKNVGKYDRVLYHFGNSVFHRHMFGLLNIIPGVVVLHDFYLSAVLSHMEIFGYDLSLAQALFHSHSYAAICARKECADIDDLIEAYPSNLDVMQDSLGVIFHSQYCLQLVRQWYGQTEGNLSVLPLLIKSPAIKWNRSEARKSLGLSTDDFVVCSFGMLAPTKESHRLLQAWLDSELAKVSYCHLIFVGENDNRDYNSKLLATIKRTGSKDNIRFTGWVDNDTFEHYLVAADLGVQLRTSSRGETSKTILDCMKNGLATIVNSNGSIVEIDNQAVYKLPDKFSDQALTAALEKLWRDKSLRETLGARAREIIANRHNPAYCAQQYKNAIEQFYARSSCSVKQLSLAIADIKAHKPSQTEMTALAGAMAISFPPAYQQHQLLVDISAFIQIDLKTGIQRVVRSILKEWLLHPPSGWRIEPVYATGEGPYRYARQFTARFLGLATGDLKDEAIDYAPGDIFFGLDFQPHVQAAHAGFYQQLRRHGITVKFIVYDLLPILHPRYFPKFLLDIFPNWLKVVGESDGAICISKAVADELAEWMGERQWQRLRPFTIEWNHLGSDIENSVATLGLPENAEKFLSSLEDSLSFLMVGTVAQSKGYAQVLDAFDQLWQNDNNIILVIVGRRFEMAGDLSDRLDTHSEFGQRLFWLDKASDEYLQKIYANSTCFIAASYGEGFGLPLIEAAKNNVPVIARDIPVFREILGECAYYFDSDSCEVLAQTIETWLQLYKSSDYPRTADMTLLTWKESAERLFHLLSATVS